jgi:uncharacterized membrane protein YphA (DoxX/SURF4 family)
MIDFRMQNERFTRLTVFAPAVVRIGISLVFLWFGSSQLADVQAWAGWLPGWTASLPLSGENLVRLNGTFEVVFGSLLLLGLYVRPVALLLALHMFQIALTVGYSEIGVRDFGLAMATTSIFLHGSDRFTLDAFLANRGSR